MSDNWIVVWRHDVKVSLCKRHSRNETRRKCVFRKFWIKLVPSAVQFLNLRFLWTLQSVKLFIAIMETRSCFDFCCELSSLIGLAKDASWYKLLGINLLRIRRFWTRNLEESWYSAQHLAERKLRGQRNIVKIVNTIYGYWRPWPTRMRFALWRLESQSKSRTVGCVSVTIATGKHTNKLSITLTSF